MSTLRHECLKFRFALMKFRLEWIKLGLALICKVTDFFHAAGMSTINEMERISTEIVSDEIMEMIHGDFDPGEKNGKS